MARNKALDLIRRDKNFRHNIRPQYSYLLAREQPPGADEIEIFGTENIKDSQLRMIFACCHPSIPPESQAALALKTLCGLNSAEIARAYITSEDTITKRIYRAREKIKSNHIQLELPAGAELKERLEGVLKCLYLLFNEGYNSSHPDQLIREDLCEEAMRLCLMLCQSNETAQPRIFALMALFCFQVSRFQARLDDKGNIILLKYQDRGKWHRPLIEKGFYFMNMAVTGPFDTSVYHLEAAIASLHASAVSFEMTDWKGIYFLYQQLFDLQPGPVIELNKAIASAYAVNREFALNALKQIKGLDKYYIYHASLAEILLEVGNKEDAIRHYAIAMALTTSKKEQELIKTKMEACEPMKI
ncbi:MAG: RNA polymerase sigma factor [Flavisolibacter sp.]